MSERLAYAEIEKILGEHKYTQNCVLVVRRHQSRQNIAAQRIASQYARAVGLTLTGSWQLLKPHEAVQRLSGMLHKSSVYQKKLLPKGRARQVALSFVNLFEAGELHCLEGMGFEKDVSAIAQKTDRVILWPPPFSLVTDEAVVVFDDTHIGLIYVEEHY